MKLSKAACDTIENALKHYLKYRVEFGRNASEQMDLDDKHRLEVYNALDELNAMRSKLGYGDLFGLPNLTPMLAPDPRDYKTEAAYLEALDKFNDFRAQMEADKEQSHIVSPPAPAGLATNLIDDIASLKTELAAALGDLIAYRRNRYADSAAEEARYRELTGHAYDDE